MAWQFAFEINWPLGKTFLTANLDNYTNKILILTKNVVILLHEEQKVDILIIH